MARSQFAATDNAPVIPGPEGDPAITPTPTVSTPPLRFRAPDHISAIILSTGRELTVENGVFDAPADLSDDEQRQIGRVGCTPA